MNRSCKSFCVKTSSIFPGNPPSVYQVNHRNDPRFAPGCIKSEDFEDASIVPKPPPGKSELRESLSEIKFAVKSIKVE